MSQVPNEKKHGKNGPHVMSPRDKGGHEFMNLWLPTVGRHKWAVSISLMRKVRLPALQGGCLVKNIWRVVGISRYHLSGGLSHHLQGFIHPRWLAGFLPSTVSFIIAEHLILQNDL